MSKERLEEIKKELELDWSDISYVVNQNDVKWLIKRVEELEEREKLYKEIIQSYGKIADGFVDDIERLLKRNEHYKQALEFYADEEIYKENLITKADYDADGICISKDEYAPPIIYFDSGEKARQALKGETK